MRILYIIFSRPLVKYVQKSPKYLVYFNKSAKYTKYKTIKNIYIKLITP